MNAENPAVPMKRQHQGGWLKSLSLPDLGALGNNRPFNPDEHFIHRAAGVTTPSVSARLPAKRFWLLSRALYVVRIVDLSDVPDAKRAAALALAQTAWTPFASTSHYVIPQQDGALLCAWNSAGILSEQTKFDVDPETVLVVPESALRADAASLSAGTFEQSPLLSEALDGVVATVGVTGRVAAEQWWPAKPATAQWINFQRSVGMAAQGEVPAPRSTPWRRAPIGHAGGQAHDTTSAGEWWMVAIAAWLLIAPTIWYTNQWRQMHTLTNQANAKLTATERELDATLGARGQALSGLDRVTKMAALFNGPDSLMLFALINDVLTQTVQAGTLQLTEWDLRGRQLKFVMTAPGGVVPTATTVVKAFEKAKSLRDVEVNIDGSRLAVSMRILPPADSGDVPATSEKIAK